jgi:HPt (histidine-containing phosphotransfer) domain-containing protein
MSQFTPKATQPMLQTFNTVGGAGARAPEVQTKTEAQTVRSASPTSMGKIFLLVGVAIVVFMAFTVYSVQKEVQSSAQLAAIKDLYFPVLQRLDANIVRIDKIEETYIQVVIAGDKDAIDKAAQLGAQTDRAFAEIAALYPQRMAETGKLRAQLQQYQTLATKTSLAFLAQSSDDMTPLTAAMNQALVDLRRGLKTFRQASYDSFEQTLANEQHDARVRLLMGLALGVMNLGFMGVLVFFIRNNMKMTAVIAVQNATLEQRVAERTAQLSQKTSDINAMLQNMKLGVSTVVPGNRIHPEYSNYLRTIFDSGDLANKDLLESLFGRSDLGVDVKDQVAVGLGSILNEEAMMFDLNGHLLPREMSIEHNGQRKIVQMDWSPIVNPQGVIEKVLLISQDVTHLRELELSSAQQKDELETISRIIRISVGKFNEFIESATRFIAANRRLIGEAQSDAQRRDPELVAALFRNMHTIKGNARTFEFSHITNVAHSAEQTYDRLRKDSKAEWNAAEMIAELDAVESAVLRYVRVNEDKLGRKGRAAEMLTSRGAFVSNEQLTQLSAMAAALAGQQTSANVTQLREAIDQLGLITLSRLVSGAVDSLSSLATELHKPTPTIELVDGDVAFNSHFAEALKSCLMHIVRNSLDHGIESPAERQSAGKSERGTLRFACARRGDRVELRIGDDGRGLALHNLYAKGVASGLFGSGDQPTPEAVADIIFRSGLSTAEAVTQVSGRGVGMDAVRTFLKEEGATIRIALREAGRPLGFTPFEFIVDVPIAACSH